MKVRIQMKDPDGAYESLREVVDDDLRDKITAKFLVYGEYLTIEVDTETMEAIVVKAK